MFIPQLTQYLKVHERRISAKGKKYVKFVVIIAFFICTECLMSPQGLDYLGHQSVTHNDFKCQAWYAQVPHAHKFFKSEDFPDSTVQDAANYCRNPDSDDHDGGPWCYTTDPRVQWEYCKVPLCVGPTANHAASVSLSQGECSATDLLCQTITLDKGAIVPIMFSQ